MAMLKHTQTSVLRIKRPRFFGDTESLLTVYVHNLKDSKLKDFRLSLVRGRISSSSHHGGFRLEPSPVPFSSFEAPECFVSRGLEAPEPVFESFDPGKPVYFTLPIFYKEIYGHWIVDLLSEYIVAKTMLSHLNVKILYSGSIPSFGFGLAQSFGISRNDFVDINSEINETVQDIVVMSPMREHDYYHIEIMKQYFVKTIRSIAGWPSGPLGDEMIYLTRRGWQEMRLNSRSLINRDAVEELFRDEGFTIVAPESMSIDDQAALFGRARIIAGESGSGLHNSIFMRSSGHVICIQSGRQTHLIQSGLCELCDQSCDYVVGRQETDDWMSNHEVDLDQVRASIAAARTAVGS